jgi:bacteriorhodopsin
MTAASLLFSAFTLRQQKKLRLFPGHITVAITTAAAISYFAMATHNGRALVHAPGHHATREIFWARYADWAITTPLLLLDLALFAGLSFLDIGFLVVADMGMILTGLFGASDTRPTLAPLIIHP